MELRPYGCTAVSILAGICLLAAAIDIPAVRAQNTSLSTGAVMPVQDRQMKAHTGSQVSLSRIAGTSGTLVVFWSRACPWVDRYEDRLLSIAREYQERGIGVIAVNPNDRQAYPDESFDAMQEQAESADYPFPYAVDEGSQIARAFGASRTPEVFLFDSQRQLVYSGAIDDNPRTADGVDSAYLRNAIDALLSGSEITNPATKTFGCTIKWQG
jgi:peroxiredoxin